jgi:2-isopropylmalate synthase
MNTPARSGAVEDMNNSAGRPTKNHKKLINTEIPAFTDKQLQEAKQDFNRACSEYASGEHEEEFENLDEILPSMLRLVKDRIAESMADANQSMADAKLTHPATAISAQASEINPMAIREIEDECFSAAESISCELTELEKKQTNRVVRILDCTLRDGITSHRGALSLKEKVWLALQIRDLGVDIIEVGAARDADDLNVIYHVAKKLGRSATVSGLVRCDPKWSNTRTTIDNLRIAFERAGIFGPNAEEKHHSRIHLFIETSRSLREVTSRLMDDQKVVSLVGRCVEYASDSGFSDIELSAMDATRTNYELLKDVFKIAIYKGSNTVNIADTAGWATPASLGNLVRRLRSDLPLLKDGSVILSVHCHDVLGMATANSVTACMEGARQVECTINGIGPRCGNAALEEVVVAFKVRESLMGLSTRVETKSLTKISRLVSLKTGLPVPFSKSVVGRDACADIYGIDVKSEHVRTYEKSLVGADYLPLLGPNFGRQDLQRQLENSNLDQLPSHITMDELYRKLKKLAQSKLIGQEDIIGLITDSDRQRHVFAWELVGVTATTTGVESAPVASVKLKRLRDGMIVDEVATGTGPIAAVFTAIQRATGVRAQMRDYRVQTVAADISSNAEAILELEDGRGKDLRLYQGRAISQDVIFASAQAYLAAINLICKARIEPRSTAEDSSVATASLSGQDATTDNDDDQRPDSQILHFDPSIRRDRA